MGGGKYSGAASGPGANLAETSFACCKAVPETNLATYLLYAISSSPSFFIFIYLFYILVSFIHGLVGIGFLLPLCESRGSNSGLQAWPQVPLPSEASSLSFIHFWNESNVVVSHNQDKGVRPASTRSLRTSSWKLWQMVQSCLLCA